MNTGKVTTNKYIDRAAAIIIRFRKIIFLIFIVAAALCVTTLGKVRTNSELTAYLPDDTETKLGIAVMAEEFPTLGTANVMIADVSPDEAKSIADGIAENEYVAEASLEYKDGAALVTAAFKGGPEDPEILSALDGIKESLSDREIYVTGTVGADFTVHLQHEMVGVIVIAVIVIFGVLLLTSRSYFEVVIYGVVFAIAALLNMGTNYWLGEISSITNSVAVILQLALAIDYAIIFAHRYQDESEKCGDGKEALERALSHSIVEICSSSLTTVSGLIALTLMRFKLGFDLGVVLAKGIVFSMLTVILFMPALISFFSGAIKKTTHKKLIPDIVKWGRFLAKKSFIFIIIFILIVPAALVLSGKTEYSFSDSTVSELVRSERRDAMRKIADTFGDGTALALLVPSGDYDKERDLISTLSEMDGVKSVTGIASVKVDGEHYLTDTVSPDDVESFLGISHDDSELLFRAYAFEVGGDTGAFNKQNDIKDAPLIDLALYAFKKIDQGAVRLTEEQIEMMSSLRPALEFAALQLKGENYDRIVVSSTYPAEGDGSVAFASAVKKASAVVYGDGAIVTGDITSARDLGDSYKSDSVLIAVLTAAFVFTIILVTFRNPVCAAILVFVIQGSIWINFSIPYLMGLKGSFVTHMIVSAIQMGATIDYAIVMMSRYLSLRKTHEKREAVALAVSDSFPTVITSGTIMSVAGFLIAFRVSDVYVGHIGFAVGRGALISVILVMTVLPQLILLFDGIIAKTTIRSKKKDL
ncbi:MAG: MMPL family transporter [Clostridia bacterium]|nr:MMPL family transporter [Clostridia bacterium]